MRSDVMTPEQRHKAMRSNRGRTGPERMLASALWTRGYRFLTTDGYQSRFGQALVGHPDIIFTRIRVAIFVDGCFWHGCKRCHDFEKDCNQWWRKKIATTRERDRRNRRRLRKLGWRVCRVWEHDLRRKAKYERTLDRLCAMLERP